MKKLILLAFSILITVNTGFTKESIMDEDNAISAAADDIYSKKDILKNRKLSVYSFSNLEGKETEEGKRISKKLLEKLIKKGDLRFIERSEINKIVRAHEVEQSGLVSSEKDSGNILPVDIMINGTVARLQEFAEISVKAVDLTSGEIYATTTVKFQPAEKFSYSENQERVKKYQSSPEKFKKIYNMIDFINRLAETQPAVFLIVTSDNNDMEILKKNRPGLYERVIRRKREIETNNPERFKKLMTIRGNMDAIKNEDHLSFESITAKKTELIKKNRGRRR